MRFQTEIHVVGMKASKGQLENGTAYDSTKVYALADLDASRGNARGMAVAEYSYGDSQNFEAFRHAEFPAVCVATVEMVTNGRTQKTVIIDLKPSKVVKGTAAAGAAA